MSPSSLPAVSLWMDLRQVPTSCVVLFYFFTFSCSHASTPLLPVCLLLCQPCVSSLLKLWLGLSNNSPESSRKCLFPHINSHNRQKIILLVSHSNKQKQRLCHRPILHLSCFPQVSFSIRVSGAEQTLAGKTASHFGNFAMFWIPLRHLETLSYIQNITYHQRIHLAAADSFLTTCF